MAEMWYYTSEGKQMEPVSSAELKQLAATGLLKPTDMVWKEGMAKWIRASSAQGLFSEDGGAITTSGARPAAAPSRKTAPDSTRDADGSDRAEDREQRRRRHPDRHDDEDEGDDDRPRGRRRSQGQGMPTGAKVALILGGSVLLIGLVVGVIVLVSRSGGGGGGPGGGPGGGGAQPNTLVATYTVTLQNQQQDIRPVNLKAGIRYDIRATSTNKAGDVDLFVMNMQHQDLGTDERISADSQIDFTAPYTGTFKIEVFNLGPVNNTTTVTVRDLGTSQNAANQIINRPPTKKQGNPPPVGGGNIVLNASGILNLTDPRDPVRQNPAKSYNVQLTAGRTYVIRLNSAQFDAYLRLENFNNMQIAADDDSGGGLNSMIVYTPQQTGAFRVIATSLDGRMGAFTLSVREQ